MTGITALVSGGAASALPAFIGRVVATAILLLASALPASTADLILHNGDIITQDSTLPRAEAIAIADGIVVATGDDTSVLARRTGTTRVIDLEGRMVVPGLNDSHAHVVRGGRFYATELRWDGVDTLERALEMVAEQAKRTPDGQWVRVIGAWSPYQFAEKRMPTPAELTAAAPDTPVFVLFLYSQGFLNKAGVEALNLVPGVEAPAYAGRYSGVKLNTAAAAKAPPGGRYEFTADGGAILHAEPDPTILYQTVAALPPLSVADQAISARHFFRELNRFGLTSVVDAGGGGHVFPEDYQGSLQLAGEDALPIRISNYLFPQRKGDELSEFTAWTSDWAVNANLATRLAHGFVVEGGGEFLVWAAGDFENFMAARPDITQREGWREQLMAVTRHLLKERWPLRIHATYDESISHIMDVFEEADRLERAEGRSGFAGIRWAIDHAETVSRANLVRIRALGGGIAVQARMAYAGEFFVDRYGADAAASAPPLRDMIEMGLPVGAGTDATRVASHNPWVALHWLVTGKTVGGVETRGPRHRLSRREALYLYTVGSAWLSGEEALKGRLAPGQFADLAVLSANYLTVAEDAIADIEAVLTITGGTIVYGVGSYEGLAPSLPPIRPDWSPVTMFGGYAK